MVLLYRLAFNRYTIESCYNYLRIFLPVFSASSTIFGLELSRLATTYSLSFLVCPCRHCYRPRCPSLQVKNHFCRIMHPTTGQARRPTTTCPLMWPWVAMPVCDARDLSVSPLLISNRYRKLEQMVPIW